MSLKGKPLCAQNWFGSLLRDPRKTQPWTAMQIWHWPHLSCLRTILWAWVLLGAQFALSQDCGMSRTQQGVEIQPRRYKLKFTIVWIKWMALCAPPVQSDLSSCSKSFWIPRSSCWQMIPSTTAVQDKWRSVSVQTTWFPWISLDFPGFLYCRACRAQTIPPYSQLSHFDALQLPRDGFWFPEWTFWNWVPLTFLFQKWFLKCYISVNSSLTILVQ